METRDGHEAKRSASKKQTRRGSLSAVSAPNVNPREASFGLVYIPGEPFPPRATRHAAGGAAARPLGPAAVARAHASANVDGTRGNGWCAWKMNHRSRGRVLDETSRKTINEVLVALRGQKR